MTDGQIAFKLLKAQAMRSKPQCKCLQVEPGSPGFDMAVLQLAESIDVSSEKLEMILRPLIEGDKKIIRQLPERDREVVALRLFDRFLTHTDRSFHSWRRWAGTEASLAGIPSGEAYRFILRRSNIVLQRVFKERRRRQWQHNLAIN